MSLADMMRSQMAGPNAMAAARMREHAVAQQQATRQSTLADIASKQQALRTAQDQDPLKTRGLELGNQADELGLHGKRNEADLAQQEQRIRATLGDQHALEGSQLKRDEQKSSTIQAKNQAIRDSINLATVRGGIEGVNHFARTLKEMGESEAAARFLKLPTEKAIALLNAKNKALGAKDPGVAKADAMDTAAGVNRVAEAALNRDADQIVWEKRAGISHGNQQKLAILKSELQKQVAAMTAAGKEKEARTLEHQFVRSVNILRNSKDPAERKQAQQMINVIQTALGAQAIARAGAQINPLTGRAMGVSPTREFYEKIGLTGEQIAAILGPPSEVMPDQKGKPAIPKTVVLNGQEMSLDDAYAKARAHPKNKKRTDAEIREWLYTKGK